MLFHNSMATQRLTELSYQNLVAMQQMPDSQYSLDLLHNHFSPAHSCCSNFIFCLSFSILDLDVYFFILYVLMLDVTPFVLFQIGASFHLTDVQVYVVDLKKCKPWGGPAIMIDHRFSPFTPSQSIRKSFSKADRPPSLRTQSLDVKTIEESTSGTDPEEESTADITNLKDYNEIFRGRGCEYLMEFLAVLYFQDFSEFPPIYIISMLQIRN